MKVILNGPFQSISGRVGNLVIHHCKNGTCYASRVPKPRSTPYSDNERKVQSKFAEAQKMTTEILASPLLRAHYEKDFKAQLKSPKPYITLRNFVFAKIYPTL